MDRGLEAKSASWLVFWCYGVMSWWLMQEKKEAEREGTIRLRDPSSALTGQVLQRDTHFVCPSRKTWMRVVHDRGVHQRLISFIV